MTSGRIDIITMGCSKNLIDSERLIHKLETKGYNAFHNPESPTGEYVVVNTCGFIGDAKEESIEMILQLAALRQEGTIGQLVVMGCLSERYRQELKNEIPEVDLWYGKFDWKHFIDYLPQKKKSVDRGREWERKLTTPSWSAYVKVSEGCNRFCAYCAIPLITGRHTSRPIEEILEEVESLAASGVKEFNIIAQDLSSYGIDLYEKKALPELIDKMAGIKGVEWIRMHYFYPTDFPLDILDVINRHNNVCNYIDIALQHISDKVLDGMNRQISKQETIELLNEIRRRVPGVHIRTTIMTGFPGEGQKEFEELKEFVISQRFERLGGFAYSEEEDTLAAKTLKDSVPQDIKQKRLDEIMGIQQEISMELNERHIGCKMKVLVEEKIGQQAIARSEFDSPEVDQEIIIENCEAAPGEFVVVKIVEANPYHLKAIVL